MTMNAKGAKPLTLDEVRARLGERRGPAFWRGLEELAGTPEFEEMLANEFPAQASVWPEGVSRRNFLSLMGASLAFGGLTACTRQPLERIVPYIDQPENIVPGKPLRFATATTLGGYATGLLAESHMGRPTKVEGNPEHPASLGSTDLFAQASVLSMYDPDRSQTVTHLGRISTWPAFLAETRKAFNALDAFGGARIRLLSGTVTSPSLAAAIGRLLERYPKARWHQHEPAGRHGAVAGAAAAFGEPVECRYDLGRAEVVLSLDSDLLTSGPGSLRYARDFMSRRRVRAGSASMSRLYAAETAPTATGTLADHRLPLTGGQLQMVATAIAAELGVAGAMPVDGLSDSQMAWVHTVAEDLRLHPGNGLVVAGDCAPAALHVLAHAINDRLGNAGSTVIYTDPVPAEAGERGGTLAELVEAMAAGEVDVLISLGSNPVYDAPADADIMAALYKVGRRIHLGPYVDETAEFSQWHVPEAHYLESWGDARAFDGTLTLQQPLIEPLYGGKSALELVAALIDDEERGGLDLLRDEWQARTPAGEQFETFWRRSLHDGFLTGSDLPPRPVTLDQAAVGQAVAELAVGDGGGVENGGLELLFRPDPTVWDGRFANNGWLQECPKPLTKLTWENAALISPSLAQQRGLATGDVVVLTVGDRSLEAPVWVLPGQPERTVTLNLGYGRATAGRVGSGIGVNANLLRTGNDWRASGLEMSPTGARQELASTQLHHNVVPNNPEGEEAEKRHLMRVGTFDTFKSEPDFVHHMAHGPDPELSMFPAYEYSGYAWGMAVDLGACTGCNACVVACQAENNIPVVGKEQVAAGREMHWIRIDRYFQGDLDAPSVHHQPVMCMHCEQAPCEVVCPVGATTHSDEGLNDMVYNRCVGTRYCSNNCPYKVRRFNFFKYSDTETPVLKLLRNPDVTVRTRGVMEKCTYCVQRINEARIEAGTESRKIRDGEVKTACQQVCPTQAIAFGDINDADSEISRLKAQPTNYALLEELGTRPRTSYLAKITNPNPKLAPHDEPQDEPQPGGHA
jgi:molybdopterin-containing oxidoreductase family iron-sulfur binding subunit